MRFGHVVVLPFMLPGKNLKKIRIIGSTETLNWRAGSDGIDYYGLVFWISQNEGSIENCNFSSLSYSLLRF